MNTAEILKMVEWYAARRVDHFRLATHETSHDLRVALDAIAAAISQAEAYRVDAERLRALIKFPWFEGEAISRLGVSFLDDDAKSYEQQVRDGIDAARKPA